MRPKATRMLRRCTVAVITFSTFISTHSAPVWAVDVEKLGRVIEQVGKAWDRQAREQALRDQAEAAELAEQERQNRLMDAEFAEREAVRQQEEAEQRQRRQKMLTPPAKLGGRIALHRELLSEQAAQGQSADLDVMTSLHTPAISPDGSMVAWETASGQVQLRKMSTGETRTINQTTGGDSRIVQFVGNDALLVTDSKNGITLFDLQGKKLWAGPGSAYPTRVGERWLLVRSAMEYKNDTFRCTGVWLHDATGKELSGMRLNTGGCLSRTTPSGSLELVTDDKNGVTYLRDGQKQIEFRGDNRRSQYGSGASYMWLGDSSLVFSTLHDGAKWLSPRIWDLASGRMLCEIATTELLVGIDGKLAYSSHPAARISLPDCRMTPLGNGRQKLYFASGRPGVENSQLFLLDETNGQVDVLDSSTGQVRTRLQTRQIRPSDNSISFMPSFVILPSGAIASSNYGTTIPVEVFDPASGKLLKTYATGYVSNRYVINSSMDYQRKLYQHRLWDLASTEERIDDFLARLQKDKFETSNDYRRRVAALVHPYSIKVDIEDYDADRGQFLVRWRDIPLKVPMVPERARKFAGTNEMTLHGELALLEGDFLELRNAQAKGPDGERIPLSINREGASARKASKTTEPPSTSPKSKRTP